MNSRLFLLAQNSPDGVGLPGWIITGQSEAPEMAAFLCGGALAVLHPFVVDLHACGAGTLLRQRLALRAAEFCLSLEGRRDSASDIRDAVCLCRIGEPAGPAGDMFLLWSRVAQLPLSHRNWSNRLVDLLPATLGPAVTGLLAGAVRRDPLGGAISILSQMLTQWPHAESAALICADVVLARGLGWSHPVPLLGWAFPRKMVRAATDGVLLTNTVHQAIAHAATQTVRQVHDLENRIYQLRSVSPLLRAKAADAAIDLFLNRDSVFPGSMLSPVVLGTSQPMTDRAARRLCDRLVSLGVVRELSGRTSFRIYGV